MTEKLQVCVAVMSTKDGDGVKMVWADTVGEVQWDDVAGVVTAHVADWPRVVKAGPGYWRRVTVVEVPEKRRHYRVNIRGEHPVIYETAAQVCEYLVNLGLLQYVEAP